MWSELIERRCGSWFSEGRMYVLRNCLWRQMQVHGLDRYATYYRLVLENRGEWDRLAEGIVNRETRFFRHQASFTALAEELLPGILAHNLRQGVDQVRLWSAGCSSGEEAYSLAIAASEVSHGGLCQFEVLGSDLSAEALAVAARGRYGQRALIETPAEIQERYFERCGNEFQVNPAVQALTRFEYVNLADPATYPAAMQDVIFCQNVFIYFREAMRADVVARLARCLRPGGYLLAAPGELAGLPVSGLEWLRLRHTMVLRAQ
jgi:type IV pilus assembly protein PilK